MPGEPLSTITARLARRLGIRARILPATDDALRTWIDTPAGSFSFQDWFVARGHRDEVDGVRFVGEATPAPGVLDALADADAILIAPSNPFVSIWPILAVPAIRAALAARRVPCVAVSPIVGGRAVRGPADRMLTRLARRDDARPRGVVLRRPDRRPRRRRRRSDGAARRPRGRHEHADDRPRGV